MMSVGGSQRGRASSTARGDGATSPCRSRPRIAGHDRVVVTSWRRSTHPRHRGTDRGGMTKTAVFAGVFDRRGPRNADEQERGLRGHRDDRTSSRAARGARVVRGHHPREEDVGRRAARGRRRWERPDRAARSLEISSKICAWSCIKDLK